jgi:hypothetical protein
MIYLFNATHMFDVFFAIIFCLLFIVVVLTIIYFKKTNNKHNISNSKESTNLKLRFPNFQSYIISHRKILRPILTRDSINELEFKLPIITFKKTMGYNFIGISKSSSSYCIYMDSESLRGYKIKGKRVELSQDVSLAEYEEIIKKLSLFLMTETDYMQITTGEL